MGDGVITLCSNWSPFTLIILHRFPPCFEPPVPLIDVWLGHAFLLVDISQLHCNFGPPCAQLMHEYVWEVSHIALV